MNGPVAHHEAAMPPLATGRQLGHSQPTLDCFKIAVQMACWSGDKTRPKLPVNSRARVAICFPQSGYPKDRPDCQPVSLEVVQPRSSQVACSLTAGAMGTSRAVFPGKPSGGRRCGLGKPRGYRRAWERGGRQLARLRPHQPIPLRGRCLLPAYCHSTGSSSGEKVFDKEAACPTIRHIICTRF